MIGIILALVLVTIVIILGIFFGARTSKKTTQTKTKGKIFEETIKEKLSYIAEQKNYKLLDGGLFKYAENNYFELDGILITSKAVYIIEAKRYIGYLHGGFFDDYLLLRNERKEIKVKNPFNQNYRHIRHFINMCKINVSIFSLIIFPDSTTVDIDKQEPSTIIASKSNLDLLLDEVETYMTNDPDLEPFKVNDIIDAIAKNRAQSENDNFKFNQIISQNNENQYFDRA
ncbi:Nuclease-related domain protein [Mycoplasmopsis agalactiae]|uniref:nuclease-related domain-containing protein n=1 Tax=Mycoplasmopsis agalactiae TaxID=2110 RepID=UPI000C706120|nr:nuclease-related domain-containing protein [Mycoplasmopsis agalactiae]SBO45228.1 Nuclease-related domain protein [Mycoplasmopsis agalactiae]